MLTLTYTLPMPCRKCQRTQLHTWCKTWLFTFYRCQKCGTTRNHRLTL